VVNTVSDLKRKFRPAWPHLDERTRRIMAATEAMSLGYGGVSLVSRARGLSRKAIRKGIVELERRGKPLLAVCVVREADANRSRSLIRLWCRRSKH
jgi:hypothetical protein